jgi:hypothetical protein
MVDTNLQRKLIFLGLLIAVSIPFLVSLPLPITVSSPTKNGFDTVQNMPDGSICFIDFDFSTQSAPECYPQALAFLKQAISKHFKFVIGTFISADAVLYAKQALAEVNLSGYTYGVDYVRLGFLPGGETSLASFGRDIHGLVRVDADGKSIDDLPLMQQLKTAKDFDIWLVGSYSPLPFVTQINAPYGSLMVLGCDSVSYPLMYPYYQSGQVKGLLNGVRGGAEYELLLGYAGQATSIMSVQSFAHVYIIGAMIVGNVIFLTRRGRK